MKTSFLAVTLLALVLLGARDVQAQAYGPYYYNPYWDVQYQQHLEWQQYLGYLQQYDPYYELHVMHYQLYLPPYQPYQLYQPCCYGGVVIIPQWSPPIGPPPRPGISPWPQTVISPPAQVLSPLPGAVSPLPRAVGPLPPATGKR